MRRAGQPLAAQDLGPVFERQVGGHDQAHALVGCGDHVEQQLRARLAGRHVTKLIEDEQIQLGKLLPVPQELTFFLGLQEQRDEFGHPRCKGNGLISKALSCHGL